MGLEAWDEWLNFMAKLETEKEELIASRNSTTLTPSELQYLITTSAQQKKEIEEYFSKRQNKQPKI